VTKQLSEDVAGYAAAAAAAAADKHGRCMTGVTGH